MGSDIAPAWTFTSVTLDNPEQVNSERLSLSEQVPELYQRLDPSYKNKWNISVALPKRGSFWASPVSVHPGIEGKVGFVKYLW